MIIRYLSLFVIACSFSLKVFSQGIQDSVFKIKEVVKTADRLFKKEEAGMKEMRVDTLILMDKINVSLSELLSENTAVFIKSHGRGALATASFRGTAASHTKVNWNGVNINNPMTGMVDFSLIPIYIVDNISLKHGAASIADQSGGLGGSINIENKPDWSKKFGLKYLQGVGSYNTFDEFLQVSGGTKKLQLKTRLYHNYSKNNYTFINRGILNIDSISGEKTNPIDTNHNADYTKYGLLQEFYYRTTTKSTLSVKYWGQWAKRTIPRVTSYEGPNNANLNKQNDNDQKIVADFKYFAKKTTWTVRSAYTYKHLLYTLKNMISGVGMVSAIYSHSSVNSNLNSVSLKYFANKKLLIKASLDANIHNVKTKDDVKKTGYKGQRVEFSGFVSAHKNFADKLNVSLMLRQDFVDSKLGAFVPFLGFDYKPFYKHELVFKGNVARNYHNPSLNDLYWQPGGNPDLKPEDGISSELGLEYQNEIAKYHFVKSEITVYRADIDNWIIWLPSFKGYWEPFNIKKVLSRGVELKLSINGRLSKIKYQVSGMYSYTSSINYGEKMIWGDESYGKQLVYIPLHSGNVFVNIAYKGFFVSFQHNSYSERFTTSSNDVSRRDWLYPYFMNDLTAGKKIQLKKCDLTIKLKIQNLFNETYHSVLYRPMPKRNYMLNIIFGI